MPLFTTARPPLFAFPQRVDERVVRTVAAGVLLTILVGYATRSAWVLPLLALGFTLRVAAGPRYSLLAQASLRLVRGLGIPPRPIPGAPKQFAASIGATLLWTASALALVGQERAAWGLAGVVVVFATLESAFAWCAGCKVFALLWPCEVCAPAADA